ncbi:MAG: M23 family metallopeptidase [Opitutaceae bacterium]|nr:M23 family metallopeptidase [Opitutaceae bacterium]
MALGLGLILSLAACGDASNANVGDASGAAGSGTIAKPAPRRVQLVWPTPNPAYAAGATPEAYVQPTESGLLESGLFGSVRSGGRQFHEGLDLFPIERDKAGEALDPVFAALAGVVRHVSANAGASSYGRYIVLEHPDETPAVYTLYAHLASVESGMGPGVKVAAGATLGKMGRSAGGYTIPKSRAHLHFEVGLRMTDSFSAWYARRGFGSPNPHGLYNGMNLMGVDPLLMYALERAGKLERMDALFEALPIGLTLRIAHAGEPDFIRRYPSLRARDGAAEGLGGGWEIDVSGTGVPVRWKRLSADEVAGWKRDEVRIVATHAEVLAANRARDLVDKKRGVDVPGEDLQTVLQQVFGLR